METVEILLATYNGEKYIREQLESIINQSYENWIVRACDDASTDKTYSILLEYKEKYPDKFIVQKNEKGYGSAKLNFLNLIRESTFDYVMCCDQDDVWLPDKISVTMQEMQKNEQGDMPILVRTDLKVVDEKLNIISESFRQYSKLKKEVTYNDLLVQNSVTGCTMMMNKHLVSLVKRDINAEKILMHDWFIGLIAAGMGKVIFVDSSTMLYRQHSVNSVGANHYGLKLLLSRLRDNEIKRNLVATMMQASEIAKVYHGDLDETLYRLTLEYSQIFKKNKLQRIQFYVRHRVLKKGIARKVFQFILG